MTEKKPELEEPFTRISAEEAKKRIDNGGVQVVDVREPNEYEEGHIPGVVLIPVDSVFARREELSPDQEIIFVCKAGVRSALACEMAASVGRTRLFNLEGGMDEWSKLGFPVSKGNAP
jgi:rhodanese-related sulfurtransferase